MKLSIFVGFIIGVLSFTALAQECVTSSKSCEFYSCKEYEMRCDRGNYLTKFGRPNCQEYLDHQTEASPALQDWLPKVRLCLQEFLQAQKFLSCTDLDEQAFASHVGCYVNTGFCDLSIRDKLAVARRLSYEIFLPRSLDTAARIQAACNARGKPF